jgi:hypothetical protein
VPRPRPFINCLVQELSLQPAAAVPPHQPRVLDWNRHREEVLESCRAEFSRCSRKERLIAHLPFQLATLYGEDTRRFQQVFREVEAVLKEADAAAKKALPKDGWETKPTRRG